MASVEIDGHGGVAMQRLSGVDASFLYLETPTSHMHVAMTGIYDTSTMPGGYSFEAVKEHIRARLHLVPPFTRRLVEVPFQLHHPVWVEDPNFDLDFHVRRIAVPAPGGRRELAEIAAQIASVPLDRHRPLWEAWVIEGLKHDRVGFVAKVHHSAIDGAAGAEIMTALYDLEASPAPRPVPERDEAEHVPTDVELVAYAVRSRLGRLPGMVPLLGRTVKSINSIVANRRDPEGKVGAVPLTAPHTPWNAAISPQRRVAFARIRLDEAKEVKDAFGVKLNDVVLAVVAGALRTYLERRGDEVPADPLLAVCPVSVRTEDEVGAGGNRVSAMFTSLATEIDDPAERLRQIAEQERRDREDELAREAYVQHTLGQRLVADLDAWELARRLRDYLAAQRSRVTGLTAGDECAAAEEWLEWCDRYVAKLDPGVQPIRQPKIKAPDYNDLREFRQRLGFGLRW